MRAGHLEFTAPPTTYIISSHTIPFVITPIMRPLTAYPAVPRRAHAEPGFRTARVAADLRPRVSGSKPQPDAEAVPEARAGVGGRSAPSRRSTIHDAGRRPCGRCSAPCRTLLVSRPGPSAGPGRGGQNRNDGGCRSQCRRRPEPATERNEPGPKMGSGRQNLRPDRGRRRSQCQLLNVNHNRAGDGATALRASASGVSCPADVLGQPEPSDHPALPSGWHGISEPP